MVNTLPLEWIGKINPNYFENLEEDEEIMWNTLWNFDDIQYTQKNAEITRKCEMIPVEVDGFLYVALAGCGMDLRAQVIYTQYKLTGRIEIDDISYLKCQQKDYIEYVIGKNRVCELYKAVEKENI
ncbi:MAG: hypothetical protein JW870_04970 [Candidatus Delongbacteria bacterium]|nr:hypothetical protein [Candidatus Delongbacteria bacterium]